MTELDDGVGLWSLMMELDEGSPRFPARCRQMLPGADPPRVFSKGLLKNFRFSGTIFFGTLRCRTWKQRAGRMELDDGAG